MNLTQSDAIDLLAGALSKAQAKVKGASRDATNPHFRSKYADLASVWEACRDALTGNGLSVAQFPGYQDGEPPVVTLTTILLHSSGQWMKATAGAPIEKADAQRVGSALTYLRRYSLAAVVGVAPEDDDGNGATAKPQRANSDGEPVLPFGKSKGTPLSQLDDATLRSALDWARKKGAYDDFQTDAASELGRRAASQPKQDLSERPAALSTPEPGGALPFK